MSQRKRDNHRMITLICYIKNSIIVIKDKGPGGSVPGRKLDIKGGAVRAGKGSLQP